MAIPFSLGSVPTNLKSIQQYLDVAADYETTDLSVSYWSLLYALQHGFTLLKSKEDLEFLLDMMEWLGVKKEELKYLKTVSDLVSAQVHVENVADKLLNWAEDGFQLFPSNQFNKIVVGAFFSAKLLLDVCSIFGELNEDMAKKKRYANLHVANMKNCSSFFKTKAIPKTMTPLKQESKPSETNEWSPEGKKIYDRIFLLNLRNKSASMKQPVVLLTDEIARIQQSEDISKKGGSSELSKSPKVTSPKAPRKKGVNFNQLRKFPEGDIPKPSDGINPKMQRENRHTDKADDQVFVMQVTEMLNDLTPSTFENQLAKIQCLKMSVKRFSEITNLIYEKIVEDPSLSHLYARLCRALSFRKVRCASTRTGTINFRTVLLARVLKQFAKVTCPTGMENKEEVESPESEDHLVEIEKTGSKYEFAVIGFIGELFQVRMVTAQMMHECVAWLLNRTEDDNAIECLCSVLFVIGKDLETSNGKPTAIPVEDMSSCYNTLEAIADKAETSDRIRSLIRNVIDLRKSQWLSACDNDNSIKTERDPDVCEEPKLNDESVDKTTCFNGCDVHTVENGEGSGLAQPKPDKILEAPIEFDQQMITPAETDAEISPVEHEAATLSNIGVDDVEIADPESNGSPTQGEENAAQLPVNYGILTCTGESVVEIDQA